MRNQEHFRGGLRLPGGKIKEFFSWLKGIWSPKYIPQRSRYGDRERKMTVEKSDFDPQSYDK